MNVLLYISAFFCVLSLVFVFVGIYLDELGEASPAVAIFALLSFATAAAGLDAKQDTSTSYTGPDPSGFQCKWDHLNNGDAIAQCHRELVCTYEKDKRLVACRQQFTAEAP